MLFVSSSVMGWIIIDYVIDRLSIFEGNVHRERRSLKTCSHLPATCIIKWLLHNVTCIEESNANQYIAS